MQNGNGRKTVTISLQPRHYDFVKLVAEQSGLGISETIRELLEHCSDLRPVWRGPLLYWEEPKFRREQQQ